MLVSGGIATLIASTVIGLIFINQIGNFSSVAEGLPLAPMWMVNYE